MNVAHHYDISDDLYFLFLDPLKQYSCAYFKNENESLEDAQKNKINHIVKKLNIKEIYLLKYLNNFDYFLEEQKK